MKLLLAIIAALALASPAYAAHGGFNRTVPAHGSYDWESVHTFNPGDQIQITEWTIDGEAHSDIDALQIGPCGWHWLVDAGDYYLSWACLSNKPFHMYSSGDNFLNRSVVVTMKWQTVN